MTMSTEVIRNGRQLKAVPLPVDFGKKSKRHRHLANYNPEWVLLPGTKITLSPFGRPEAKSIITAAEVASQISARVITGRSRVLSVVQWRTAAYLTIKELCPHLSGANASRQINRDHTTMVHARKKHEANPDLLASKIAAIKAVLK